MGVSSKSVKIKSGNSEFANCEIYIRKVIKTEVIIMSCIQAIQIICDTLGKLFSTSLCSRHPYGIKNALKINAISLDGPGPRRVEEEFSIV